MLSAFFVIGPVFLISIIGMAIRYERELDRRLYAPRPHEAKAKKRKS